MHRTRRADCRWTTHIMLARNFAFLNIDDFHLYRNSSRHVCSTAVQLLKDEVDSWTSHHPSANADQVEWGGEFEKEGKLSPQTSTRKCTPPNQPASPRRDWMIQHCPSCDENVCFLQWLTSPVLLYCVSLSEFVTKRTFFAILHFHLICFCKGWHAFGSHKSNAFA